jgi:predicted regulator of Ras-like GTPase activity (Roadblock/LC7/MglB family)
MASLSDMLATLNDECGARASAVVSKDGLVLASSMPDDVTPETFGIMTATIIGASITASSEMKSPSPNRILIESDGARTIIFNASRRNILVVVVPGDVRLDDVEALSQPILDEVNKS